MPTCLTGNRTIVWQRSYRQIHWQWNPYVRLGGKHAYLAIGLLFGNVVTGFIKGNCPLKFVAISLLACYWMATGLLLAISGLRLAEMLKDWQA